MTAPSTLEILSTLPRIELCTRPTPIQRMGFPPGSEGIRSLMVKCDDCTSAIYGGNKVRKLEFLLGQALQDGCRAVLTFGAYGSNHALATAVHAQALGLEAHAVLSPQGPGPFAARTLRAHAGIGTHLHPVEGWDGRPAAEVIRKRLLERDGVEPCIIPVGGTNACGALGYVDAAFELWNQIQTDGMACPDRVYVAGGTLGTAIGLAIGLAILRMKTRVIAVRVTPEVVGGDAIAENLAVETLSLLHSLDASLPMLSFADLNFELRHEWFKPGYGVATPEGLEAVALAAQSGVQLETTYTGKTFAALVADAQAGKLKDQDILFWNTYSSAPMPPEGPDHVLPQVLQNYVLECDRTFGCSSENRGR